ncbi:hypothetical protein SASPL_148552 [Salvia splendens]|uniref:Uncharacterized protein n=1 Tax=Salvia splendens TaxID=180675 RepID=A0A8X8Z3H1_SALSN|nr:hypothetical protein SASPL_148552 [Salvia splendens]
MVISFRRSLSFPNQPFHNPPKPKKSLDIRSTSLPCACSHPIISHLQHHISDLQNSWPAAADSHTSAWLCDGLRRLKSLHDSLDDLLHLPQTRESLRGSAELYSNLLEDFLRFVDVHGTFQTLLLRLEADHSAAQIAVRRKDTVALATHSRNLSKWKALLHLGLRREIGALWRRGGARGCDLWRGRGDGDGVECVFWIDCELGGVPEAAFVHGANFGKKIKNAKVEGGGGGFANFKSWIWEI